MTTSRLACATAIAALSIALGGTAHADTNIQFMTGYTLTESGDSTAVTCQNGVMDGVVNVGCSPASLR
ncbi:hypothetical protein [Streptomyces anulatus]|uniref:hypothetical protein n=1 Tax=Streptomyces anulatus TaxID=1892 RepID=UPI003867645E|nr:hypothetical protein OG238_40410 [Streptomyces anulatus]